MVWYVRGKSFAYPKEQKKENIILATMFSFCLSCKLIFFYNIHF